MWSLNFSEVFISMRNSGIVLMTLFADFGRTFTSPFVEGFLKINMPQLYRIMEPFFSAMHDAVELVSPDFAAFLFGFTMFDLIGFGLGVCIIIKLWKTVWDALPFA